MAGVVVWEVSKRFLNGKTTSIRQMLAVQSEKLDTVVTNQKEQTEAFKQLAKCVNGVNNRLSRLEGEHSTRGRKGGCSG